MGRPAEQLHQRRPGGGEALGHLRGHGRIVIGRFPLQMGQPGADPPGRDHEHGEEDERQGGDLPGKAQHHAQGEDQGDQVADDTRQGPGEGPLGADHVVVQPADQGPGAGPGEERHRHPLHVAEHGPAEVEDQALADLGRLPAFGHPDDRVEDGHQGDQQRQQDDPALVPSLDDGVDHPAGQHRGGHRQDGGHDAEEKEGEQGPPVRPSEGPDAAQGGATEGPPRLVAVHRTLQRHPMAETHLHRLTPHSARLVMPACHRMSSSALEVK